MPCRRAVHRRPRPENSRNHLAHKAAARPVKCHRYTATHSTKVAERMVADAPDGGETCRTIALPVKIEDGVWIGGGSIILPGVTIGRGSVIGAGSVVTRSIPADCVAVGNPCRVIKQIDNGGGAL